MGHSDLIIKNKIGDNMSNAIKVKEYKFTIRLLYHGVDKKEALKNLYQDIKDNPASYSILDMVKDAEITETGDYGWIDK